jgi:hypothetical protein
MRKFIIPLCFIVLVGCREESPIDDGSPSVVGYRIEGSVVDSVNKGIYGVSVRLAFTYLFVDSVSPESRVLIVPHAGNVQIRIYDMFDQEVREIFNGDVGPGEIEFPWDYCDDEARHVGSGLYYYSYTLDDKELLWYPILIDSAMTSFTDNTGSFAISDVHFPIGATVPRFSHDGTFLGNFLVYNTVQLIFELFPYRFVREVTMSKGRLVTVKQIL